MTRLVSFRKLKISSGLVFLKRSFKLLVWYHCKQICLNLSQFMRMCLTVRSTLHDEHIGRGDSIFRKWVTWVWPIRVVEGITSFFFFFCSLPATHLWYLVYGGA